MRMSAQIPVHNRRASGSAAHPPPGNAARRPVVVDRDLGNYSDVLDVIYY